jgi:fluoroquinolone transport system ATP-binding protein
MIRVEHLYHSYRQDGQFQVNDVSFQVAEGEIFGFLGPNGAGKSTIQKILTGLLPLQRGEVRIGGEDVAHAGRRIYNQVGVAFEQPYIYKKLTGLENLVFYAGLYGVPTADPMGLLERFGLADVARARAGTYSRGMQQRLALARSLLNHPRIWFLDEPTSGLDPAASQMVRELIRERQRQGVTVFLTTHDMHAADVLCDRVAFLDVGRVVALDAPRTLKLRYGEQVVAVEHRVDGQVLTERLNQASPEDRRHLLNLMEAGRVETIHSQEATLESVFIALTGRGLT